MTNEEYYAYPAISHSAIMQWERGDGFNPLRLKQVQAAMKLGSTIDRKITEESDEPLDMQQYSMVNAFIKSEVGRNLLAYREKLPDGKWVLKYKSPQVRTQTVFIADHPSGVELKGKADIEVVNLALMDLKSTDAKTLKDFEKKAKKLGYIRQAAFYMSISGYRKFFLIGISKTTFEVFKLVLNWEDDVVQQARIAEFTAVEAIIKQYKNQTETE